jgi:hypothetical protein
LEFRMCWNWRGKTKKSHCLTSRLWVKFQQCLVMHFQLLLKK